MKILKIDLSRLRNEEHFQFMTDTRNLIRHEDPTKLNVVQLFAQFTALCEQEDIALERIRKNVLTDPIGEQDALQDSISLGFELLVQAYSHSTNAAKVEAARKIQIIIDHYGDFRRKSYNEETAIIHNFIQDLRSRCSGEITTLNANEWVDDLAGANHRFKQLMNERFDNNAGEASIKVLDVRKSIDRVYNQLTDRISASILLNGEADYAAFVNKLNERITYFKNTLAQRKGRANAK